MLNRIAWTCGNNLSPSKYRHHDDSHPNRDNENTLGSIAQTKGVSIHGSSELEHFRKSRNTVSAGFEAVLAVLGKDVSDGVGDGVPELLLSSGSSGSQVRFQLGKDVFDGVQIWRIRRQKANLGSGRMNEFGHSTAFVGTEIVENDDLITS